MKRRIGAALLVLCLLTGCAAKESAPAGARQAEESAQQTTEHGAGAPEETTSAVADASQMTAAREVVEEGMVPVHAAELKEGTYPVAVESSSSMFKIADCTLTVKDNALTAELTMSSDTYAYLYPGSAEEAAAADVSAYLTPTERRFALPVEALDLGVPCAAWSRNKELWYDRTLVFRADSLPLDAFRTLTTAESLGLRDGDYTAAVKLTGGSGKAAVASPAKLRVRGGEALAEVVWSSANYDYMLLGDERYDAEIVDGHSVFRIPVAAFDRPLAVVADTTAMSQPYEIAYALTFDSATLEPQS